jgi:hypothetical protein
MGVSMVPATSLTRPVHGRLSALPGRAGVILADAAGIVAVARLLDGAPAGVAAITTAIVEASGPCGLEGAGLGRLECVADVEAGLTRLAEVLATAEMGTRLQIAGSDTLIGRARRIARDAGLDDGAVETELCGSEARRIQCIHCKSFTDGVTTQTVICPGCGLRLTVRDHYSRRLAAYQAVWVGPGAVEAGEGER